MRGRKKFQLFKPVFAVLAILCRLLPRRCFGWVLSWGRYMRGVSGLALRYIVLNRILPECGDNVSVHDAVIIRHADKLSLGKNISIHPFCYLDAQGKIEIGDDVSIAHNVSILSFEHDVDTVGIPIKDAPCLPRKIKIENNVWIGAGVRVLGGVNIGTGAVVGANAVVTRDIPPGAIAVGVPARVLKIRAGKN